MKRTRVGLALAVLVLAPTAIAISGDTFWDGGDIAEMLSAETAAEFQELLTTKVQGELRAQGIRVANVGAGVVTHDPKKTWDGLTLLGTLTGDACPERPERCSAILIDMHGNKVAAWPLKGAPVEMLPNGHVMGGIGAGFGNDALLELDFCGNEVWRWEGSWHHDFHRADTPVYATGRYSRRCRELGNRTLILSSEQPDPTLTGHISDYTLLDDTILEVDDVGNVLFEWHAWEHFDQMGFDDRAKEAIKTFRVGRPRPGAPTDWTHQNNVGYLGPNKWYYKYKDPRFHPDNIVFDFRTNNIVGIIARHPHPDGETWDEGDIIWKVGPHYWTGYPEKKLGSIIGPHHAHLVPWNLPGGGNMLVFDNGGTAGYGSLINGLPGVYPNSYRNYSRIVEFNPKTLQIEWEYQSPVATEDSPWFFSALISGMQRLPNGNTLITEGNSGRIFEVTRKGKIVWDYYNTWGNRPTIPVGEFAVYRALRVPYSWAWKGYKECAVP